MGCGIGSGRVGCDSGGGMYMGVWAVVVVCIWECGMWQ